MPEPKSLWRVIIATVAKPIYLVAQNASSAVAQATNHPQVVPGDLCYLQRIDAWDEAQKMTIVHWPEPPPEPQPPYEPPP